MSSTTSAVVIGVGPGLGMSMARRFGHAGHRVALLSRSAERHDGYRHELTDQGIDSTAYSVDVTDRSRLYEALTEIDAESDIEVVHYGPALPIQPRPITEVDRATAEAGFDVLWPAIDVVNTVLPSMRRRGRGALFFAGGLSSVRVMPAFGQLGLVGAALRNYALTLHAALADDGIYAGTLTIGGLVERGDIHTMITENPDRFGPTVGHTLDPDMIAETAWEMYRMRDRGEEVFDVL